MVIDRARQGVLTKGRRDKETEPHEDGWPTMVSAWNTKLGTKKGGVPMVKGRTLSVKADRRR